MHGLPDATPYELAELLRRAQEEDPVAQIALAKLYERGSNSLVKTNAMRAAYWYCRAAENGDPEAMCSVAKIFAQDNGNAGEVFSLYQRVTVFARANQSPQKNLFEKLVRLRMANLLATQPWHQGRFLYARRMQNGQRYAAHWQSDKVVALLPL